ncbi:hypothetical protein P3J60_001911 [Escherichia coli]|nr:hypothetical protein [Escherichia coli]
MDEWYQNLLILFLAENWALFERFCEEHGEDSEDIYHDLGGDDDCMSYSCDCFALYRWRDPYVMFY